MQNERKPFRVALIGSRFFAASVFQRLRALSDIELVAVIAPAADDRLALAGQAAGIATHVLTNPKIVPGDAVPEGIDLIVAAHTHARVSNEALARARLGGVGYHPSLLPRHRGIAAVEWTILEGDAIAGGSVYHLADGWDAGAIAAQDWCFVARGETARELWERALAPMGLALLERVVLHAKDHGELPATTQDTRFATRAPLIRRAVVLSDEATSDNTALVVTISGADRPGIVNALSECAHRHGANWAASRLARAAGEFAGMVHFDVPSASADALEQSLRALESAGLRITVVRSAGGAVAAGVRSLELKLVGDDRPGIVSALTRVLAQRSVSIENLHTEIVSGSPGGSRSFRVSAHLLVPAAVSDDQLHAELDGLARSMMLDVALSR